MIKWWTKDMTFGRYDYAAATIDKKGILSLNKHAQRVMGEWKNVRIGFDDENAEIVLEKVQRGTPGCRAMTAGRINTTIIFKEWGVTALYTCEGSPIREIGGNQYAIKLSKKRGPKPKGTNDERSTSTSTISHG